MLLFTELCHGCGGCSLLCPEDAIEEVNRAIGVLEKGKSGSISFIDGKLNLGEAMAVPLVRAVKRAGLEIDPNNRQISSNNRVTIIDVPPGTSCPVIESVKEPTPFGLNDLILAVEMLGRLKIPFGVLINRADVGDRKVDEYCKDEKIPILMRIPMDRDIAMAYSKGIPIIEAKPAYKKEFLKLYEKIEELTGG